MNIRLVDPARLIAICTAISHGFTNFEKVCEFIFEKRANKISSGDKNHVSRAITTAEQLGMIRIVGRITDGNFEFLDVDKFDPREWDENEKSVYLRSKLQAFPPFLRYFDFVARGFSHKSSASNVTSLFEISPDISGESNILKKWGIYSKVFEEDGAIGPTLAAPSIIKDSKFASSLSKGLDSELSARSFLQEWLGDDAYNFIDEDIRKDLTFALLNYKADPEKSLARLGHALEDHIKLLAKSRKVKLEDAKGKPLHTIGQMINTLRSNKILADHHSSALRGLEAFVATDALSGLNAFRKMTSHGKNVDANQRWSLGVEIAFVVVLQTILAIRSTYYYTIKNKLSY